MRQIKAVTQFVQYQAMRLAQGVISAVFFGGMYGGRAHDGASYTRSNKSWSPSAFQSPDRENLYDIPVLRDRSRDLHRNSAIGRGAIKTMVTNVVGRGLEMQSKLDSEALGISQDEAEAWENKTERLWRQYTKECDAGKQLTFSQIQKLAYSSRLQSGEIFAALPIIPRSGSIYGMRIKLIEADMVAAPAAYTAAGRESGGIEFDPDGVPISYNIYDWQGEQKKVPAYGKETGRRNIIHYYISERPGQSRGVPWLSPVLEQIKQLGDYKKSEMTAAVVQSLFTAFVKSSREDANTSPFDPSRTYVEAKNELDKSEHDYTMGPGAFNRLLPDEDITFANPTRPNSNYEAFVSAILKEIGMGLEIPYEILRKMFEASYSASRGAKIEFWKMIESERLDFEDMFLQPIYSEWLYERILMGDIDAPGFMSDPIRRAAWSSTRWVGQPMGQIDETKEVLASQMRIQSGFSTHQEETATLTGGDWEQNVKKLVKERSMIGYASPPPGSFPTPDFDGMQKLNSLNQQG